MRLPLDILRTIIIISKINDMEYISLTNKVFYLLCCERYLWIEKFKNKELIFINNDMKNVKQYIDEYKKVSYAFYISTCLFNLVEIEEQLFKKLDREFYHDCLIYPVDSKYLNSIDKLYIKIDIKGEVKYYKYDEYKDVDEIYIYDNNIAVENYCKSDLILFITKMLYYIPDIAIYDASELKRIFSYQQIRNWNINQSSIRGTVVGSRIKYWNECYSKYEI